MQFELFGLHLELVYVLSGLAVGFIVGMTGVGGGSLMTPILLFFGISPSTAVGTDLLYAAITKSGGIFVHQKKGNIDWRITCLLAAGSLPAAAATLVVMHLVGFDSKSVNSAIKMALGITLVLTALAIVLKQQLLDWSHRNDAIFTRMTHNEREIAAVITGVVLGIMVTITSIGAGALGTVALFLIYPILPVSRLVGTEIAHAVPLTLVAGLGHAGLGNVNWDLLINLLLGSLPGIYVGSHLPTAVPEKVLRPILASIMILVGAKLVLL
jgi:uncharacterized membrane protein YfcA